LEGQANEEISHGGIISSEAHHGKGDARVQTRRIEERPWRQGGQGQEPPASDRYRAAGSRRLEIRQREAQSPQPSPQEREGRSHVGASRERESTKAMGGRNARKQTARGHRAAVGRARKSDGHTRQELYAKARKRHVEGRSKMTKRQLENALGLR
jgi:hypothetical protein